MSVLKFGACDNKKDIVLCLAEFYASQKLPALGGRFVYYDISDGYWKACADNAQYISGWSLGHIAATSATNGGTKYHVIDIHSRIFELPYAASGAAATLTEAVGKTLLQKKIDLYVDSNGVQYADNATSQAILQVKGFSVSRNSLSVMVLDSAIVQVA